MRAWWRHWNLEGSMPTPRADEGAPAGRSDHSSHSGHSRHSAATAQLLGRWEGSIQRDWSASLSVLEAAWQQGGGYDGILGFSNGAAAAFLFAAHAAAHADRFPRLRFVMLASGYVPLPMAALAPGVAVGADGRSLLQPLPFASLHMIGSADPVIEPAASQQLAECFDAAARWVGWLGKEARACVVSAACAGEGDRCSCP